MQNFLLTGYRQPAFYLDSQKTGLDSFEHFLDENLIAMPLLNAEGTLSTALFAPVHRRLYNENEALVRLLREIKTLYRLKGFKDFGAEGAMHHYRAWAERVHQQVLQRKLWFARVLYTGSAAFVLLLFFIGWSLAKYLSRDVALLNQQVLHFVRHGLRDAGPAQFHPRTLEVKTLYRSYRFRAHQFFPGLRASVPDGCRPPDTAPQRGTKRRHQVR